LPRGLLLCLDTSNQKSSQQKCFFAHRAFHAQIKKTTGWNRFSQFVYFFMALKNASQFCRATLSEADPVSKNFLCPLPALKAISFLDFCLSLSADGERKRNDTLQKVAQQMLTRLNINGWAVICNDCLVKAPD